MLVYLSVLSIFRPRISRQNNIHQKYKTCVREILKYLRVIHSWDHFLRWFSRSIRTEWSEKWFFLKEKNIGRNIEIKFNFWHEKWNNAAVKKKVYNLGYFLRDWTITVLMDSFKYQKGISNVTIGTWYKMIGAKNRDWNKTNNKNCNSWKLAFKKYLKQNIEIMNLETDPK